MIVVTGGAGFIGSCFVRTLNRTGVDNILVVDHLGTDDKWKNLVGTRFDDFMDKDVFIRKLEQGALDCDIESIVHIGACSATTETDAGYLMENNFHYSCILGAWCAAHKKKMWYASSAATYGDGTLGYSDDDAATPKYRPMNMYGFSKHLFDLWVLRKGLHTSFTGFKYFNVFGPNEYHKGGMRSVINKAFPVARDQGVIRLFESHRPDYPHGGQKRDFVYVKDVLEVMAWFFAHPDVAGIYNLGTGKARTWNDVATSLFAALNRQGSIEYIPMPEELRGQYQYFTEADMAKLRRAGCTHTFMSLEESVADYVRSHLATPDPYF